MSASQRFEEYMEHLAGGLGHRDRHAGLKGYCTGLMLPLSRKSVEPMAARVDPLKYSLSTLPDDIALNDLVAQAHMRWRIERDYQNLKQELGLGHYEGRGWRGFHHHATLSIAAYGFLVTERLAAGKTAGAKKNFAIRQIPALPADDIPRGSPARTAARIRLNHYNPLPAQLSVDRTPRTMSLLRATKRKATFVTQ